jgi:hypothetical protein
VSTGRMSHIVQGEHAGELIRYTDAMSLVSHAGSGNTMWLRDLAQRIKLVCDIRSATVARCRKRMASGSLCIHQQKRGRARHGDNSEDELSSEEGYDHDDGQDTEASEDDRSGTGKVE